jgi:large repetitive protein
MRCFSKWILTATLVLSVAGVAVAQPQPEVLIIWDVQNADTVALGQALGAAGMTVTYSSTNEASFDGTNPDPSAFDAVIHLNATTGAAGDEMPLSGQIALVDFVYDGGVFIGGEWNGFELQQGRMTAMDDLILLTYNGHFTTATTMDDIPAQAGHPILANVPSSIPVGSTFVQGQLRTFASDPPLALMADP